MIVETVELTAGTGTQVDAAQPPRITVLQQASEAPLGLLGAALGQDVRVVRLDLGEPVPAPESVGSGLVVLGGPANAYDDAATPWLPATRALLSAAVAAEIPTLAVCLGAQLLAVAEGGSVEVGPPPGVEAGVVDVFWREAAKQDPVLGQVACDAPNGRSVAVSFHSDAVSTLPAGATWLASSKQYPYQAFRVGSALGLQFHPEAGKSITLGWALGRDDVDPVALDAALTEHGGETARLALKIGSAFAAQVDAHAWR